MPSRAIVIVAGGTANRFGGDKLMVEVAGKPIIAHTIAAMEPHADMVVVATRPDLVEPVRAIAPGVEVTRGGESRTDSELAGLTALGREFDLIGIHDGARPLVSADLVERLFAMAADVGGAVPALEPAGLLIDMRTLRPIDDVVSVQTPQVFRGPELLAAYVRAAQTGFTGHDTVDVITRFGDLEVAAVQGEEANIKVTFPEDLEKVRALLEDPSRSEPR